MDSLSGTQGKYWYFANLMITQSPELPPLPWQPARDFMFKLRRLRHKGGSEKWRVAIQPTWTSPLVFDQQICGTWVLWNSAARKRSHQKHSTSSEIGTHQSRFPHFKSMSYASLRFIMYVFPTVRWCIRAPCASSSGTSYQ